MRWVIFLLLGFCVFIGILFAFFFGLYKYPDPTDAKLVQLLGLNFGFWSAFSWGLSVIGNPSWNSWFNFFAAAFAASSLGYLTSLDIPGLFQALAERF
jgi:hypothetical protein